MIIRRNRIVIRTRARAFTAGRGNDLQEQGVLRRSQKGLFVRKIRNLGHSRQHRARFRIHRNRSNRYVVRVSVRFLVLFLHSTFTPVSICNRRHFGTEHDELGVFDPNAVRMRRTKHVEFRTQYCHFGLLEGTS